MKVLTLEQAADVGGGLRAVVSGLAANAIYNAAMSFARTASPSDSSGTVGQWASDNYSFA